MNMNSEITIDTRDEKFYKRLKKKMGLKPNMWVENLLSGNQGQLLADRNNSNKLAPCGCAWVIVMTKVQKGKNAGKLIRAYWIVENIKVVEK